MVPVAANSGGIVYYHYIIKLSRLVQKCRVRVPKRGGMSVRRVWENKNSSLLKIMHFTFAFGVVAKYW